MYKAEWTRKYETHLSNNYIILISKKIEYFLELDFGTKLARKIILISKKKKSRISLEAITRFWDKAGQKNHFN